MKSPAIREKQVTLLDLLDRILHRGVIVYGDITLSVADVDLVYLSLKLLLTSVERAEEMRNMQSVNRCDAPRGELDGVPGSRVTVANAAGSTLKIAKKKRSD